MKFDLSQLGTFYDYLSNNSYLFLDAGFLIYSLYMIILYFNVGITNIICRLMGYVGAFFLAKLATEKLVQSLSITEPLSIILLGSFTFFLLAYFIYRQVQFLLGGSRSTIDSILGAAYGAIEVIFFVAIVNTCALHVHKNGFNVPDPVLAANGLKEEDPGMRKSLTYLMLEFVAKHTSVVIQPEQVEKLGKWVQMQFNIPDLEPGKNGKIAKSKAKDTTAKVIDADSSA